MDKKKREKKIKGLEKQKEKHLEKLQLYGGKDYSLIDYWKKEINRIEEEIKEEKGKL